MDQNTDTTFAVLREIIAERPTLSPLVKTAEVGREVRDNLPSSAFADPVNREFPVHTKEHALLSSAYAEKTASVAPEVTGRIQAALTVYGATLPKKEFEKVAAAAETPDYLLPHTRQFPIYSGTSLKLAHEAISRNQRKLSPTSLATAASVLVKHAAARDEELPTEVYQWAGIVPCDRDKAAEWIDARGAAAPAGAGAYTRVAQLVRSLPFTTERAELTKVAEAVSELDKQHGLARLYGKSLPDPLKTVFNTKEAMTEMVDLGGTPVALAELVKKGPEFYSDVLGPEVVEEIAEGGVVDPSKVKEIFPTLPRDMHALLLKQLGR